MARKPRINVPGMAQHVIHRGNNREPCFFQEADYRYYLHCLFAAAERYGCLIRAYVLMTNHVHLLVTPQQEWAVAQVMQSLGGKYMKYVNRVYKRTGTIWEGRYKASLVDSERYLLTCMRYIELNPVRAGMTQVPSEYPWSSYRANAYGESEYMFRVDYHSVYRNLGVDAAARMLAYRTLFRNTLSEAHLHEIRDTVNCELVLGRDDFRKKIEAVVGRSLEKRRPGRPRVVNEITTEYLI